MKKRIALLLAALALACLAVGAGAEAPGEGAAARYLGGWISDEYRMYIRLEDDGIYSRLTQTDGDYVWEFDRCLYDEDEGCLYGMNYVRYREYIDPKGSELIQEDWSLGDLAFASFAFADDGDTLVASDIPYIDEPLTFHRASDAEYFGS